MYSATLLLSLLSINLAVSLPAPDSSSIDMQYHINARRENPGWCTLHYYQTTTVGRSNLFVFDAAADGVTPPALGGSINMPNGAFSPLPGYGDFLVVTNDASGNVTFRRHGTISGDTWTILHSDSGDNLAGHQCNVGGWFYGDSRTMDCGFGCTPYTGPYA